MNKLTCALFLSLTLPAFAVRQAPVEKPADMPAPAPATATAGVTVSAPAQLDVKNKSSFATDENSRNPFWPLGWRPAAKASATSTTDSASSDISASAFVVSSITVDASGNFAIVNGKVMNEGQVFGLQIGNQTYQLTVKAIQDGQVILQRRDQEIIVPLRRR